MEDRIELTEQFPQLTPLRKRRVLAGVRPFRKEGIRVGKQIVGEKIIVHNYGHGGAGVSLAPATSLEAAQIVERETKQGQQITILGCGIMGIMTALQCVQKGRKVKILAERVAKPNQKNVEIMQTSEVAPGYWLPYHYQFKDKAEHDRRVDVSYQKYVDWMKKLKSLRVVPVYESFTVDSIKKNAPQCISKTVRNVQVKIGSKKMNLVLFQTIQIHLQLFLQQLLQICKQKGIQIIQRKFQNCQEIQKLQTKVIVNCLGLGSKKIFNDNSMYGVKGHLIQFQNTSKIKGIFGFEHKNKPVKLYCFDEKILVGLTKQNDVEHSKINTKLVQQFQQNVYSFYNSLQLNNLKPKL